MTKGPALAMAFAAVATVIGIAAWSKAREPGADIRNPKTLTKVFYDRLPEFTCPPGQRVVWTDAREIGCEG